MTVQTGFELETIERLGSIGNVAFSADDRFVFSGQWIARFLMMFQGKCRWFKSLFHMATSTFAMIRAISQIVRCEDLPYDNPHKAYEAVAA